MRGSLTAEAKAVVRAQHLRAMASIPRWAYGYGNWEMATEYLLRNSEFDAGFCNFDQEQVKERMTFVTDKLDEKAEYFIP